MRIIISISLIISRSKSKRRSRIIRIRLSGSLNVIIHVRIIIRRVISTSLSRHVLVSISYVDV